MAGSPEYLEVMIKQDRCASQISLHYKLHTVHHPIAEFRVMI